MQGQPIMLKDDFYNESSKYVTSKTVKVKVSAQPPIRICVNSRYLTTDRDPVIVNSRTLVPTYGHYMQKYLNTNN